MKLWYAYMMDKDDNDWGAGSYDRATAFAWLKSQADRKNGGAYLAVIDSAETNNALCVDEIRIDNI